MTGKRKKYDLIEKSMRLVKGNEQEKATMNMIPAQENRGMEDQKNISIPNTSPNSSKFALKTNKCGSKKRNISEAFEDEQIEGEVNLMPKRRNQFGEVFSEVKDFHVSHQPVLNDLFTTRIRVRFNFRRLIIPDVLQQKDEKAMLDLHMLLKEREFEVHDRPTLAFFAIGARHNVLVAASCFEEL